jgi:DNA-binding transcriptional LysR family regulator
MHDLDWNDLRAFLAIARAGQLSKAGAAMGINGTTLGRRLRRLESALGCTLFEQTRAGQVLTDAGENLLIKVETMSQAALAIGDGKQADKGAGLSGILRISVSEGFGSWLLARHVADFATTHPSLTLDLVANSSFLSLSKREADMAVMLSRPKAGPVIASKLSDYLLRLYASNAFMADRQLPTGPVDLAKGYQLVGYIPDLLYAPELNYLDEVFQGLRPRIRSSSINAQHKLIAAGAGIGILPCFIGDTDPNLVAILPKIRIKRSFWLVTLEETHQLARVKAGKEWITRAVQQNLKLLIPQ